jgi:hypothetical protein
MENIHKLSVDRIFSHKCYLFQWSIKKSLNDIEKSYVLINMYLSTFYNKQVESIVSLYFKYGFKYMKEAFN